jgi:hypothetical protein
MLDVWVALGGEPAAFYRMWDEDRRTPADTWAQLMAVVGQRLGSLAADTNPPAGPEFDRLIFPGVAGSATPTAEWVTPVEDMWQDDDRENPDE